MSLTFEEFFKQLEIAALELERMSADAAERNTTYSGERYSYSSSDRAVTVVVDGNGELVDLTIAAGVLGGPRPQFLGSVVVDVVNAARRAVVAKRIAAAQRIRA